MRIFRNILLLKRPDVGFSGAVIMSLCDDINAGEVDLTNINLTAVLDYLDDAFSEKRQYFKKMHIPVALYVAGQEIAGGFRRMISARYSMRFSKALILTVKYMAACKSGSSKRNNVQTRLKIVSGILDMPAHKKQMTKIPASSPEKSKKNRKK